MKIREAVRHHFIELPAPLDREASMGFPSLENRFPTLK
jgi:hypothetical protein